MIRIFISLLIVFFSRPVLGQIYLDNSGAYYTEFENGRPSGSDITFENFTELEIKNIYGLSSKSYTVTNAETSSITINKNNLGRLVLYTKLISENDSLLFNPFIEREGTIEIKLYRSDSLLEDRTRLYDFGEDIFQQIHINTLRSGIDKAVIKFHRVNEDELFIIEKLKLVSYNPKGIHYYSELEIQEKIILDITSNMTDEAEKIKRNLTVQLSNIEVAYKNLKTLTNGRTFEAISNQRSSSFNPFKNDLFSEHYEDLLLRQEQINKEEINKMVSDFNDSGVNLAMTLDQLFLGGKFTNLFISLDSFLKSDFTVENEGSNVEVISIQNKYYISKKTLFGNKLKLSPLAADDPISIKINDLKGQNEAYKLYISKLATFLKEDIYTSNKLDEEIALAEVYLKEYEELIWEIVSRYTDRDKTYYIDDGINFTNVTSSFENQFQTDQITAVDDLKKLRTESITIIKKMDDLTAEYESIISKIKTSYDLMYKFRPENRKEAFIEISDLPYEINLNWATSQLAIVNEYEKEDGVRQLISLATGKEANSSSD